MKGKARVFDHRHLPIQKMPYDGLSRRCMDVDFGRKFKKQYKKLSEEVQGKFDKQLSLFRNNPQSRSLGIHRLHGKKKHLFSMNVTGNYRALFLREHKEKVVFREIGTHSQLYG